MKTFDILDRDLDIHQNLLLEASAGTGKTFSIENIYVRLLIEDPALTVDEILVVTFTRAATSELRERIHQSIETSLYKIKTGSLNEAPDYLKNAGPKEKRRLENALSDFDQSCITTIHGFCEKTLKENAYLFDEETESMSELVKRSEVRKVIHDFFLTGLKKGRYSPAQLKRVLSHHRQDLQRLEKALYSLMTNGLEILSTEPYEALFDKFQRFMAHGKYDPEKLYADFATYAPSFNKILTRQKEIKPEHDTSIREFCNMFGEPVAEKHFEKLVSEGLLYATLLDETNMRSKAALPDQSQLHYPDFLNDLRENLLDVVEEARNPHLILGRMACDCQKLLHKFLHREEKYQHDDLLKNTLKRASGAHFAERLRELYKAVIIDEFQDTDPIQWGIFHELFLKDPEHRTSLYLVGDPKQSIYAFRQADIYTYLSAADALGTDHVATLSTNYRSTPDLVEGLNVLFSRDVVPDFFHLPKLKKSLSCNQVKAGRSDFSPALPDDKKSIHLMLATGRKKGGKWPTMPFQRDFFFPSIVNEMIRLKDTFGISFSSWAILVRDRYQAEEFARFCQLHGVPARKQKQKSLVSSHAYPAMKDLLHAIIHPHDLSALKLVLGGCLIELTPSQLLELEHSERLIEVCDQWAGLCEVARTQGFSQFMVHFMNTQWNGRQTLYETCILQREELFDEWCQLVELLSIAEHEQSASILRLEQVLEELDRSEDPEDESLKCRQNIDREACEILTIHTSKGLEYDIVVPIGLINRTPRKDYFVPIQNDAEGHLQPVVDETSDLFLNFQKEIDAEKMRQLYVALTRARHRLYLPIAFEEKGLGDVSEGEYSPWELFLLNADLQGTFQSWLNRNSDHFSYETIETPQKASCHRAEAETRNLVPPKQVAVSSSKKKVQSFSSLAKQHDLIDLPDTPPHDFANETKTPFTIPSGRDIGLLMHSILELIAYDEVKRCQSSAEAATLVRPFVQNTPFCEWLPVISEMVFTALKKPLKTQNGFVTLSEIPDESRYHEIEFLYSRSEGLLKGVIDLVFEWEGLYYLVDWKSNWLGSDYPDYSQTRLTGAMRAHEYDLQESIYREALKRYLKAFDERPFETCFGGSYYLFLRGMNMQSESGIYSIRGSEWE